MDLDELSKFKEGNRLEAKSARGGLPRSVWETVSAFANTSGGRIVLGLKEHPDGSFELAGVENAHKMLDDFWNAALSDKKLSARFLKDEDVRIEAVDGKEVVVIDVPRADRTARPVFLNRDILGETWRRTHTGDHRCTREEVQSMLRDATVESADSRLADSAKMADLDPGTVERYRRRFGLMNEGHIWNGDKDEDFLRSIGAADEDADGVLRPTLAGLLMFGLESRITRVFPDYFLDYRQEAGAGERWEDRFVSFSGDWSGNVYDFYFRVYNKLKAPLKVPFRMEGIDRVDDTPAHQALREAIVNCITNANYHERRGIVCVWKDDALVIENPGDFRMPLEEAMRPGSSDPRNATMLKMFAMVDAGERAGSGISKILHGWRESGYADPVYSEEYGPDRTRLVLPLFEGEAPEGGAARFRGHPALLPGSASLTDGEKAALAAASLHGRVTTSTLSEALGVSKKTASRTLKRLAGRGLLVWRGSGEKDPFQYYEPPEGTPTA